VDQEINTDRLPAKAFMHGRVNTVELVRQLKQMDVFVFPTTFEGSSISIYQAMAMQMPVITTPNSGSVLQDRDSGLFVPVSDKAALLQAMNTMFDDVALRERLGKSAFALSRQYRWEDYKNRLSDILRETLITKN